MASNKDDHSPLEPAILSILHKAAASSNEGLSRKKLLKKIQRKAEGVATEKIVDDLLARMCGSGKVVCVKGKGKHAKYIVAVEESSSSSEDEHSSGDSDKSDDEKVIQDKDDIDLLPFAERMRRKRQAATVEQEQEKDDGKKSAASKETEDIDDEIKRLEAELEASGGGTDDSDDDDSDDDDGNSHGESLSSSMGASEEIGARIISLSAVADERIPALPKCALPLPQCKRTLKIDREMDVGDSLQRKKRKKGDQTQSGDGLKAAVREMLGDYVARSSERLPFYCRVCAKQMSNEEEFRGHKKTEFHKVAVKEEQKASYCRLCRKQFTSPVQLKEHLNARPHREKLAAVKMKQQGGRWTKTNYGKRQKHLSSGGRQWC